MRTCLRLQGLLDQVTLLCDAQHRFEEVGSEEGGGALLSQTPRRNSFPEDGGSWIVAETSVSVAMY